MTGRVYSRSLAARTVALAIVSIVGMAANAAAQGVSVSGRLYHSVSTKPIAGATVAVEGTTLETKSGRGQAPAVGPADRDDWRIVPGARVHRHRRRSPLAAGR